MQLNASVVLHSSRDGIIMNGDQYSLISFLFMKKGNYKGSEKIYKGNRS